jgi:hypothetical protein
MHNVQIIRTHNKQTHYQPKFPKKMDNKKFINKQKLKKKSHLTSLA